MHKPFVFWRQDFLVRIRPQNTWERERDRQFRGSEPLTEKKGVSRRPFLGEMREKSGCCQEMCLPKETVILPLKERKKEPTVTLLVQKFFSGKNQAVSSWETEVRAFFFFLHDWETELGFRHHYPEASHGTKDFFPLVSAASYNHFVTP